MDGARLSSLQLPIYIYYLTDFHPTLSIVQFIESLASL